MTSENRKRKGSQRSGGKYILWSNQRLVNKDTNYVMLSLAPPSLWGWQPGGLWDLTAQPICCVWGLGTDGCFCY